MPAEYKNYPVEYSSGRGSIRVRKGRAACPEFWTAVESAGASGAAYCGFHHGQCDPGEMATSYQCAACYRARLVGYSNYRPPTQRQAYADICPRPTTAEILAAVTSVHRDHRSLWDEYSAEAEAKAAKQERRVEALRLLAEFKAESSPPREKKSTPVEVEQEPDYGLYSPEVAARMAALRKELGIE